MLSTRPTSDTADVEGESIDTKGDRLKLVALSSTSTEDEEDTLHGSWNSSHSKVGVSLYFCLNVKGV